MTQLRLLKFKMRQIRDIRQFFRFIRIISMSGEAKVGLRLLIFLRKKVYIPMILIRLIMGFESVELWHLYLKNGVKKRMKSSVKQSDK